MDARRLPAAEIAPHDRDVLNLLAAGLTLTDVAQMQRTTEAAVAARLAEACEQMGALNQDHAVAMAVRAGWITGELPRN